MVPDGLPNPQRALAFLAIAVAITLAVLDGSMVGIALPVIAREFGVSAPEAIWVTNAYQLAVTVSLLPLSSLGEIHGYRRVYWAGLAVFTVASLGCALASSVPALVAARAIQGLGAAGIMSVNIALVRFIFPTAMIGRGVGYTALAVAASSAAGPTIGAALLSVGPWPILFLVNLPLGIAALAIAIRTLPSTPLSGTRFDLGSAILSALTFGLLILGMSGIGRLPRPEIPAALIAGAVLVGIVFARRQLGLARPMLPVDLLRRPVFALSVTTSGFAFCAQMLVYVSLPFWFHQHLGRSEVDTGLLMTPWPVATALASPLAGRLADRFSPGHLGGIGLALFAGGFLLLAFLPDRPEAFDIVWRLAVCGFGFGLFQAPNNKAMITSTPPERSGGASGMQSTARLLGQSFGAALAGVLFAIAGPQAQIGAALSIAAAIAILGAVASMSRRFDSPPPRS
jgi:DHA2 family multidrug resistance protein-like MFS transporter